jgi:hypothetical protein
MRKLVGLALTAALTVAPASAAWADRDDRDSRRSNRRSSSCTLDLGVLTRTVSAQALCGAD